MCDINFWLKKYGAGKDELPIYKSHIRNLLNSETCDYFDRTLESQRQTWSKAFSEYHDSHMDKRICSTTTGKLPEAGFSSDSITTNNSESMNAVIKCFQSQQEVPVDKLVFAIYCLQLSYGLQLNKSIKGFGPYSKVDDVELLVIEIPECRDHENILLSLDSCAFSGTTQYTVLDVAKLLTVVHIPQQQCFSVSNSTETVHSVRVYPRDSGVPKSN